MTGPAPSGAEAGQAAVIAFLGDPATHGGAKVEIAETHISRLFLAGDRAFKLKRAVRTNYLDFTTLAARERFCRREIEVNAGAREIYLGVLPVTRDGAGLRLGGAGEIADWLVEMRRFDRAGELDRLAERGALTLPLIEALADAVAAMHRAAPRRDAPGEADDVPARIAQIGGALAAVGLEGGPGWAEAAGALAEPLAPRLDRRRRLGRVRRCHGDLHLGNIVLLGGRPVLFDAIEFSEAMASIDVLYDLALALADLWLRGERELAAALTARYLAMTRDYAGLAVLPLFLSMRAAVRAMTAAARGDAAAAAAAFALAGSLLAPAPAPRLVAIGGASGSGKSSLARALAPHLAPVPGAVVVRSDVVRKRLAGIGPETRLPAEAYTPEADARVLARLSCGARQALKAGASVVLDTTFLGQDFRDGAERLASAAGVPLDRLWLELPTDLAAARVEARQGDASDATADIVRRQAPRAAPPPGWTRLDAAQAPDAVLRAARAALAV